VSDPIAVGKQIVEWLRDGTFANNTWVTLRAMLIGFSLGATAGVTAGYVTGRYPWVADILSPFITALYTLPRLALAPLFVLWFGIGLMFEVVFTATIVFFLVYRNTHYGVREVSSELIGAVRVMGGGSLAIARRVILPSALVWVIAGLRTSVPYALVGVVVAEMLVSSEGLGYLVISSSNQYFAAGVLAAVAALIAIGLAIDGLMTLLVSRALRWKQDDR